MEIDESRFPVVRLRWEGVPTDAMLDAFLAAMDRWLEGEQRVGLLIDTRGSGVLAPEQRVRVISHMKQQAERTRYLLVQAIVIESVVQRTLFYGINVVFPNPFPSRVFAKVEPAREWLLEMLGER
jgi:hypothetical protein